ncbi:hypothetical protein [Dongia rigui]|uniref:Uncharacterized protein n=1 Tax=Dongia rigui TaxID=940149 RepID=A0ABU5DTG2_9PROT|nr:hypothetical protein [Dongia rigui]MDY0870626.1 hypothetical protein [Dongia rigui]
MLLSACAGAAQNAKKPVAVAAKPAVKAIVPEEPIIPKLKPKTPKRAPASPKLTEAEPAAATAADLPAGTDAHQLLIGRPDGVDEARDKDAATPEIAPVPAPAVMAAEPEPIALSASTPEELKSKAESEVATLLGRPVATRREGTGTIWTYRAGTCSLDVYFFLDVADNQRRALSYEMQPEGAEDAAVQSCYKALKEAHHVP